MKPYETKKCLNCEKEFVYTNGNPYKKYCDNRCQHIFQKKNGTRTKPIPYTKELLEKLYITNKISVLSIANKLNTSISQISRWLKRYNIPTRIFSTKGLQTRLGAKLSEVSKGKIRSKAKERVSNGTYISPGYIDGRTPENKRLRSSSDYKIWREAVFKRDNYTCQHCGIKSGKGIKVFLNADHIKPFSLFPELRLAIDNGRTLCIECHKKTDTFAGKIRFNQITNGKTSKKYKCK